MNCDDPYLRGKHFVNYPTLEHFSKARILSFFLFDLETIDCVKGYLIELVSKGVHLSIIS